MSDERRSVVDSWVHSNDDCFSGLNGVFRTTYD